LIEPRGIEIGTCSSAILRSGGLQIPIPNKSKLQRKGIRSIVWSRKPSQYLGDIENMPPCDQIPRSQIPIQEPKSRRVVFQEPLFNRIWKNRNIGSSNKASIRVRNAKRQATAPENTTQRFLLGSEREIPAQNIRGRAIILESAKEFKCLRKGDAAKAIHSQIANFSEKNLLPANQTNHRRIVEAIQAQNSMPINGSRKGELSKTKKDGNG